NPMIAELEPMYRGKVHQITLMFVAILIACAVVRRSLRAGEWLWLGGMFILFVKCGRAAPIFAPIFAPVMSWSLPRLSDQSLGKKWVNVSVMVIVFVGAIRIGFSLPDNQRPEAWMNRNGPELPGYPTKAAEFVDAKIHRSTGRLINEFDWGGYLAWKLPQYQVMLDGRTQLYTADFWRKTYLDDKHETTKLLASVEADAAILPVGTSRFRDSLRQLGWKRIFNDARAEVMVPPTSVAGMDR
ncbi:MAG TPA: hypothetical protein VHS31_03405, partial [Tepidisphaeraceae bacterium]|nr:hypothetical protein [Tepidisphaeraceae bacterium]